MSNRMSHNQVAPSTIDDTSNAVPDALETQYADRANPTLSSSEAPLLSPTAAKRRKSSKMKGAKHLSRSASTPQMRDTTASDSDADKKRNKLGYQRISIACAHCRRRKIRCVLAEADPQQRCQNCIRLKKDCVFYPVDQQAALEGRSDTLVQPVLGSGPPSAVSPSPPNHGLDRPFDTAANFAAFPTVGSGIAVPGQPGYGRPHYYRPESDTHTWPPSATLSATPDTSMSGTTIPSPHSFANYQSAPTMSGDFAPFPGSDSMHMPHPSQHAHNLIIDQQRNDFLWQQSQPMRSMSYGHIDHLPGQHGSYNAAFSSNHDPQPPGVQYPPASLDMRVVPMMAQAAGPHSAPVGPSLGAYGSHHHFATHQNQNNTDGGPIGHSHTYPPAWYTEHASSFGPLAEEPDSYGDAQRRPG